MLFILGLLGLIVGSFLNVLILRYEVRSLGGRSECMQCRTQLRWFDLIPVFSWILLWGRCRHCRSRISLQYPLVEGTTALLFVLTGSALVEGFSLPLLLVALPILSLLIAISVYDLYHTIIPDAWVYTFDGLAFLWGAIMLQSVDSYSITALIAAGPLAAFPLFALWLVSRGQWMGLGDAKLALGIGWLLGPSLGIVSIFFAFVIGAVISVGILLLLPRLLQVLGITFLDKRGERFTMKSEIPFGPFLVCSCLSMWLLTLHGIDPMHIVGLSLLSSFWW